MSVTVETLETTVAALETKITEVNATLLGLAQAVIDLKNAVVSDPETQAKVNALTIRAQAILDSVTLAEDAADDQLPAAPSAPEAPAAA